MNLAIETKQNNIGFFTIDGRHLSKFIAKVKTDIPDWKEIWSYSYIERSEASSVGVYKNIKTIASN